ncbi:MAG: threonylcarbamoyl-AMP synthase [Desulfobacterales bacterium]|nr:threonylcarbamoyl-AMP synthase [Desulfobacterales bacterium]
MVNKIHRVHPVSPRPQTIEQAADAIKGGQVVVFPTRTLYGLGVDPFNGAALERLFAIKQRPGDRPVSVLVRDRRDLAPLVQDLTSDARRIMDALWPGQVTLVLAARHSVPRRLTAGTGKIGVRMPAHPVAVALVAAMSGPVTATSANLSGRPGCWRIVDLHPHVAAAADMVLDAGPLDGGIGSTVVDVTGDRPRVLREGTVSVADIIKALGHGGIIPDLPIVRPSGGLNRQNH